MKTTLVLFVFFFFTIVTSAQSFEMSLNQLVNNSDLIIKGEVVETPAQWKSDHRGNHIYTHAKILVRQVYKGNMNSSTVTIELVGGSVGSITEIVSEGIMLSSGDIGYFFLNKNLDFTGGANGLKLLYDNKIYTESGEFGTLKFDNIINSIIKEPSFNPIQDAGLEDFEIIASEESISIKEGIGKPPTDETYLIYDATKTGVDYDGDLYFSEYTLTWDPDVSSGTYGVYEKIYRRLSSSSTWSYLTSTSTHYITGNFIDRISKTIKNTETLIRGTYYHKIELYKASTNTLVYTYTNDPDLIIKLEKPSEDAPTPIITSISPSKASAGTNSTVIITGSNFGSQKGIGKVEFFYKSGSPKIPATIVSWSNTRIECKVNVQTVQNYAASSSSGPVTVTNYWGRPSLGFYYKISFGYGLKKWGGTNPIVQYRINENYQQISGEGLAVRNGATTWNGHSRFTLQYGGTTSSTVTSKNGVSEVLWMPLTGTLSEALAVTYSFVDIFGKIIECDIAFNTAYIWSADGTPTSSEFDVQSVALHEFGHFINLRDLYGDVGEGYDKTKVMYGRSSNGVLKRSLHMDDIAGIKWVYPLTSQPIKNNSNSQLELISFNADVIDNYVALKWSTSSNIDFEVQRSIAGTVWEDIGLVPSIDLGSSENQHSFIDNSIGGPGKYSYRLKYTDIEGKVYYSSVIDVIISSPGEYSLQQNFPNPFNPTTKIRYNIPEAAHVTLKVYNTVGEEMAVLVNESKDAGSYEITFNAGGLSNGVYFYELRANNYKEIKKLILMK